jgi:hypothetical protein
MCPGYVVYLQTFFLLVCVYVPRPGCFAFAELLLVCVCSRALASTLLFRLNVADFLLVCVCVCGRPPVRRACSVCSPTLLLFVGWLTSCVSVGICPKQFSLSSWLTASLYTFLWTYESAPFLAVPPCILSFSSFFDFGWILQVGLLLVCSSDLVVFPLRADLLHVCVCVCVCALCLGRFT